MASTPPGQRKQQILQALAAMLEQPKGEKITTAALAARLAVSEAALYRHFASRNPGMTRVLIGDALVNEDERLQARMNQFYDRVELALKQALRVAVAEGRAHEADVGARAAMLVSFVIGRWHRYAKSGFKLHPAHDAALQIALLLN